MFMPPSALQQPQQPSIQYTLPGDILTQSIVKPKDGKGSQPHTVDEKTIFNQRLSAGVRVIVRYPNGTKKVIAALNRNRWTDRSNGEAERAGDDKTLGDTGLRETHEELYAVLKGTRFEARLAQAIANAQVVSYMVDKSDANPKEHYSTAAATVVLDLESAEEEVEFQALFAKANQRAALLKPFADKLFGIALKLKKKTPAEVQASAMLLQKSNDEIVAQLQALRNAVQDEKNDLSQLFKDSTLVQCIDEYLNKKDKSETPDAEKIELFLKVVSGEIGTFSECGQFMLVSPQQSVQRQALAYHVKQHQKILLEPIKDKLKTSKAELERICNVQLTATDESEDPGLLIQRRADLEAKWTPVKKIELVQITALLDQKFVPLAEDMRQKLTQRKMDLEQNINHLEEQQKTVEAFTTPFTTVSASEVRLQVTKATGKGIHAFLTGGDEKVFDDTWQALYGVDAKEMETMASYFQQQQMTYAEVEALLAVSDPYLAADKRAERLLNLMQSGFAFGAPAPAAVVVVQKAPANVAQHAAAFAPPLPPRPTIKKTGVVVEAPTLQS